MYIVYMYVCKDSAAPAKRSGCCPSPTSISAIRGTRGGRHSRLPTTPPPSTLASAYVTVAYVPLLLIMRLTKCAIIIIASSLASIAHSAACPRACGLTCRVPGTGVRPAKERPAARGSRRHLSVPFGSTRVSENVHLLYVRATPIHSPGTKQSGSARRSRCAPCVQGVSAAPPPGLLRFNPTLAPFVQEYIAQCGTTARVRVKSNPCPVQECRSVRHHRHHAHLARLERRAQRALHVRRGVGDELRVAAEPRAMGRVGRRGR